MFSAYINKEGRKLKVDINKFINNYKRDGYVAYCNVCNNILNDRAGSSLTTKTHFWHNNNPHCPTVKNFKSRYQNLKFRYYRLEQKQKIVNSVKENLSNIYLECKHLCNNSLYYNEFQNLLKMASDKRVWEYAHLDLKHVPYCLLTLKLKFTNKENKGRSLNMFFSFTNQYISDTLWIDFTAPVELIKFEANTKELLQIIEINDNFLKSDLKNKDNYLKKLSFLLKVIY
ncbi:MAG: hypothetical protein L3J23_04625 [Flavobacteriaceae bacterium]|nr:hypothetical protein [Flavobacteriaceae bacterium]